MGDRKARVMKCIRLISMPPDWLAALIGGEKMVYEAWVNRIALETNRGDDAENDAIQILAYMHGKHRHEVWSDLERRRVELEQVA